MRTITDYNEGRRTIASLGRWTNRPSSLARLAGVPAKRVPRPSGFTLIELVLSIAIIGIMAALVGPTLITGVKSYDLVAKRRASLASVKPAMDRMYEEIIRINDTNAITTFTATNFTFDLPTESGVAYTISGGNLTRSGVILADSVTSLAFTYLDVDGNPTAVKANIKRIGVEISVSAGAAYGTLYIKQQVFPRRFGARYAGFQ